MADKLLISSAYLPPAEYFARILDAENIFIEKEENYIKQTYRNRCYILSAHGPQLLSVPVYLGSVHKTSIKEIRIDYSKRWQQVHLRAMSAAYKSSPYFEFYFDSIEKIISENHEFLLDLNLSVTEALLSILKINKTLSYTVHFEPHDNNQFDFRYKITPKKGSFYTPKRYMQVFDSGKGFIPNLSIVDLIFNTGPEALKYL